MTQPAFHRIDGTFYVEGVSATDLAAQFGTPLYVYSRAALTAAWHAYADACAGRRASIHVAVKANSNLAVLNLFARLGAGFDIVSGGELARVLAAGGKAENVVFSGVGKTAADMRAALEAGVKCFNVESIPELDRLNAVAGSLGKKAPVSLRVNPDVDPKTHPYISTGLKANKFGVAFDEARATYRAAAAMPNLDIDVGGGLGIRYRDETPPEIGAFVRTVLDRIEAHGAKQGKAREVFFEPGRSLVGNAGVLLTRVEFLKPGAEKNFAIVDAAMNDLARPAMYDAYHAIEPVVERSTPAQTYDVVGPVCESGDWLGRARTLAIEPDDLLAIRSAGAYGFVMSSNYNTRPRAAEVMVDGTRVHVARERETVAQLLAGEQILPD
jgi:diaminopimelate decarboxylase